jgi:hypothetical protein
MKRAAHEAVIGAPVKPRQAPQQPASKANKSLRHRDFHL